MCSMDGGLCHYLRIKSIQCPLPIIILAFDNGEWRMQVYSDVKEVPALFSVELKLETFRKFDMSKSCWNILLWNMQDLFLLSSVPLNKRSNSLPAPLLSIVICCSPLEECRVIRRCPFCPYYCNWLNALIPKRKFQGKLKVGLEEAGPWQIDYTYSWQCP